MIPSNIDPTVTVGVVTEVPPDVVVVLSVICWIYELFVPTLRSAGWPLVTLTFGFDRTFFLPIPEPFQGAPP